jgi:hypothetical protein
MSYVIAQQSKHELYLIERRFVLDMEVSMKLILLNYFLKANPFNNIRNNYIGHSIDFLVSNGTY